MQDVWCTTIRSWQGRRFALPLHPSCFGAGQALSLSAPLNVSPFHNSQEERFCSSCTSMTKGHFIAPWNPRPELSRPGPRAKGDFDSPLCNPIDQPDAGWIRANSSLCWITASGSTVGLRPRIVLGCVIVLHVF